MGRVDGAQECGPLSTVRSERGQTMGQKVFFSNARGGDGHGKGVHQERSSPFSLVDMHSAAWSGQACLLLPKT